MTIAAPPAWGTLEDALRQRRPVRLTYHGRQRTVCPHALGWKRGRAMLLGYQTSEHTQPVAPRPGWRNFYLDEIDDAVLAEPATTWQTADNYNASHPFSAIDHVTIAVPGHPRAPLR
ncbi:MAG: WYL domain-containing protein [Acidimicrobiia bacterium]